MITHRIRKMIVYIWIYYEMREEQSFRNPRSINVKIKLAQSSQLWIYYGYIMDILWIYYGHGYGCGYGYISSRIRWPVRHAQRTVPGGSIRTAIGFRHFLLLMSWSFYVSISWVRNFLCSFRSRRFWGKNQFLRSPLDDWSLSTWEIFQLFPDFILIYSTLLPNLRPH